METTTLQLSAQLSKIHIFWLTTHFVSLKNEFHTFYYHTHRNITQRNDLYVNTLQKLAYVICQADVFNRPVTPRDLKEIVYMLQELKDQITTSANEEGIQLHELLSRAKDSIIQIIIDIISPATDTVRLSELGLS